MLRRLNIRDECERIRYQSVWDESVRGGGRYGGGQECERWRTIWWRTRV